MSVRENRDRSEVLPSLSPQAHELLDHFDSLWLQGQRPTLEQFIADCPESERFCVLVELVRGDLEFRLQAGEDAHAEEYLRRFPESAAQPAIAAELTAAEARLRDHFRQAPASTPTTPPVPSDNATTAETVITEPESAVPRPPVPRRYDIKRLLGEGGMGDVWLGRDRRLRRPIAVKVVQQRWMDNANILRRFVEEAQLTSQLQHPAIPPVYEMGELPDGRPYFCMKVVRGRTLASLLEKRSSPSDDLLRFLGIFEQVCQAVAYAHSKGVIHRDLKPQNVMVGAFGEVQVMDWGLAKVLKNIAPAPTETVASGSAASVVETDRAEQPDHRTKAGSVLGTLAYMPPEQARGEVNNLDKRCDVFALGAILCEVLTGSPPYQGTREEVWAHAQVGFTVPALSRLESCGAEGELTALARSCLSAKMDDRPADAGCVAAAVAGYLSAVQERLRQAEVAQAAAAARAEEAKATAAAEARATQARATAAAERRSRRLALGLVAALALGIAATGYFLVQARDQAEIARGAQRDADDLRKKAELSAAGETEARKEADRQKEIAQSERGDAVTARKEAEFQRLRADWLTYSHQIARAQREWEANNVDGAWEHLEATRWDFRGWEYRYLATLFNSHPRTFYGHTGGVASVAFSPDGQRIVSGSYDGLRIRWTLKVWDATTGQDTRTLTLKGGRWAVRVMAFSPDSKRIVGASADNTLTVWDAQTGQDTLTLKGHTGAVWSVAFSPDGQRIVSGSAELKVWDAQTGQNTLTLNGHTAEVWSVAFSPDGQRIVSGSRDQTLKVWDVQTGQDTLTLKGHKARVRSVAFSPDGKRIVSASDRDPGKPSEVKVWDAQTGQESLSLKGHTAGVRSVAFSPDGKRIVGGGGLRPDQLGELTVWDAQTGQDTLTLKGHAGGADSVAFSPDSKRIVSGGADRTVKVWDATGQDTLTLKGHAPEGHAPEVMSVAFSPDSKRIVSGGADRTVKVWDTQTGQNTLTLKGHTAEVISVAFSPDGQRIVSSSAYGVQPLELKVWDAQTGQDTRTFTLKGHGDPVAFSPDGKRIVSGSWGPNYSHGELKVWDAQTGRGTLTLSLKGNGAFVRGSCVAFSPDGKRIVSVSWGLSGLLEELNVWDAQTGEDTLTLNGQTAGVRSVAFSPDGNRIVGGSDDGTLNVWETQTGQNTLTLKGHTAGVRSVAFSPDGKRIVTASGGVPNRPSELKVWDATGQDSFTLKGHRGLLSCLAFSPDGKRIVSGGWDDTLNIWTLKVRDAQTGQGTLTLKGDTSRLGVTAFSPDGQRIVSGSEDGTLKVWDATTGRDTRTLTLKGARSGLGVMAFSPDSKRIVGRAHGEPFKPAELKVWDAQTGEDTLTLKGHPGLGFCVAFSPDGQRIVGDSADNTLTVWDAETGQDIRTLKGHLSEVISVAFSPDGQRIVSGSRDETLKVWDAQTGQHIRTFKGHSSGVTSVAFSPDGQRIVSGSMDGTLKVWDAQTGKGMRTLKGHSGEVSRVAFSPDGQRIISGSADGTVKVWLQLSK